MFKDFQKVHVIFGTLGVIQKIDEELWENSKFLYRIIGKKKSEILIGLEAQGIKIKS